MELDVFRAAAKRIAGRVRRTPLIEAAALREPAAQGCVLDLKLECLQVTGSFKARGVMNKLGILSEDEIARGIVTASGGNHGLGVAYAGWLAKTPATVYLGRNTPAVKLERLAAWGATTRVEGAGWDEANQAALAHAMRDGLTYIHPFADAAVIAGQGTIALEVIEDAPDTAMLIVPIGGGGLIAGVAAAAHASNPAIRIIGVEPVGAPTLHESLRQGRVVTLPTVDTAANTLAPRRSDAINYALIRDHVEQIVLVEDVEMRHAARWLWQEMGIAAELAGAASMAALRQGRIEIPPGARICAIVSGTGDAGIT